MDYWEAIQDEPTEQQERDDAEYFRNEGPTRDEMRQAYLVWLFKKVFPGVLSAGVSEDYIDFAVAELCDWIEAAPRAKPGTVLFHWQGFERDVLFDGIKDRVRRMNRGDLGYPKYSE